MTYLPARTVSGASTFAIITWPDAGKLGLLLAKQHARLSRWVQGGFLLGSGALATAAIVVACTSFSSDDTPDAGMGLDGATPEAASSVDAAKASDAGDAAEPLSLISPYRDGGLTYPQTIIWTLSALDDAIIHYTTDGSDPKSSPKTAAGTVTLKDLVDGTVIKWTAGQSTNVHTFVVHVDGPDGGSAKGGGDIFQDFRFATTMTAITKVPRGVAALNVTTDLRLWNPVSCPTCVVVYTIGIDKPSDCFAQGIPPTYPGLAADAVTFHIKVPAQPGIYPIRIGAPEVYDCTMAMAQPLSDTQVGILVVTP